EQVGQEHFEEVEEVPVTIINNLGEAMDGDGRGYGDDDTQHGGETGSIRSNRSGSSSKGGWSRYIWGGKPKNGRVKRERERKRVDGDTFTPPTPTTANGATMTRTLSRTSVTSQSEYASPKLIRTMSNHSYTDGLKSPPAETVNTTEHKVGRERKDSAGGS